jgi:microcystin-dependent protein
MAEAFLGEIRMFGGNFAPAQWAMCNGQPLSISQNSALFSILGTTFGGDGVQTFKLPDLRGRVPIHQGQGPGLSAYTLGASSGTENVTLLSNQMPVHTHPVNAASGAGTAKTTSGNVPSSPTVIPNTTHVSPYSNATPNVTMNPAMIGHAGGNSPFPIIQPYLCVTFIISLAGIFPSRN